MSPLELEILLHYRYSPLDYRNDDFSSPSVRSAIDRFVKQDQLLVADENIMCERTYMLSSRGVVFINKLCTTPLPTQSWGYHDDSVVERINEIRTARHNGPWR